MKTLEEHTLDENKIMTNFYETNYKYYLNILNKHINNRPLKIFKKKYKKWEKEKIKMQDNVNTTYKNLLDSYKSIEDNIK